MIPNRIVIGAIDNALNRVDGDIRRTDPYVESIHRRLQEERAALREARDFIIAKRNDQ